jgi:uncharacterized metal-binding protein
MSESIRIKLADEACSAGLRYARKHLAGPPKDAVICCEGMCLKGETARRAANLIAHRLVLDRTVRICHGGLFEKYGGMRDLVKNADRVLVLDGCGMACGSRLTHAAFPGLKTRVVFADRLLDYDQSLFGVDEMEDGKISENAMQVARKVVSDLYPA